MNIIEKVRTILTDYPQIAAVCNTVHIDFTDPEPASFGLTSADDKLISEDVLGNQKRQHTFLLYAVFSGINDLERMQNSSALLGLNYYLSDQPEQPIDGGVLTKLRAGNGQVFELPEDNAVQGVQYQMQITAEYTREA